MIMFNDKLKMNPGVSFLHTYILAETVTNVMIFLNILAEQNLRKIGDFESSDLCRRKYPIIVFQVLVNSFSRKLSKIDGMSPSASASGFTAVFKDVAGTSSVLNFG
jgi:hypothetical protein